MVQCDWLATAPNKLDVCSVNKTKMWWMPKNDHVTSPLLLMLAKHRELLKSLRKVLLGKI